MKVKLISEQKDLLSLLYIAATTCYNPGSPIDKLSEEARPEKKLQLINHCIKSGHHSVLEHACFTFAIEGVSRSLTHQLVRHRMASYSQQSQRYVDMSEPDFIVPENLPDGAEMKINKILGLINTTYLELLEMGVKKEDARCILPNCTSSNLTMTLNLRELIHIANERLCTRAQLEIRQLVKEMCTEVSSNHSWIKPYLSPKCDRLGYCPESNGCGRKEKQ